MTDQNQQQAAPNVGAALPRCPDCQVLPGQVHAHGCPRELWSPERPDVVRTVDQLDALPPETVIKTEGGSIACRHYDGVGVVFGDDRPFPWTSSLASELPGVILWHPDWSE